MSYHAPTSHYLTRNISADGQEGYQRVRDRVAANDTGALDLSSMAPGLASPDTRSATVSPYIFNTRGHSTVLLQVWGTESANNEIQIAVYGWAPDGPGQQAGGHLTQSQGRKLLAGTLTLGSTALVNTCPVTGETIASTNFYQAAAISASYVDDSSVVYHPEAGTGGAPLVIAIDPLGDAYLYPQIVNFGGTGCTVTVGMKAV